MIRTVLKGTGSYLPEHVVSNDEMARRVDTSDEWIRQRTGITQRHFAAEDELTSDLAVKAARGAMQAAGLTAQDVDCILVATTTPDLTFPATAARVQAKLGVPAGRIAFDIQAVCSGFLYGITVADSMIRSGAAKTVLLIGAEVFSRLLNWDDRATVVLFGDGAGAVILQAQETDKDIGIIDTLLGSDGENVDILCATGGPGSSRETGHITMAGREVFKHAVSRLAECAEEILRRNDLTGDDLDFIVPHQANQRIIDATARKLGLPAEKVILTVQHHANTSAASVPLALDHGFQQGLFKSGDLLLLEAMGAGLTWGSALLRL